MIRTILGILGIILAAAILYYIFFYNGGVFQNSGRSRETPLNIDLNEIKPKEWEPVGDGLVKISIDDDSASEWLLLYKDTGDTDQIGGVIYDAQNQPKGVTAMAASQQSPAYLIPYRLMPDYVPRKSVGYLADTEIDYNAVSIYPTTNQENKEKEEGQQTDSDVLTGNRLQVSGRFNNLPNRFSVFWWIDPQHGYGGTLAYTPGWFSLDSVKPHDWPKWAGGDNEGTTIVKALYSWEPQMDRSNICRVVKWELQGDQSQDMLQFASFYPDSSLRFCRGNSPSEPAFPEAQVLAYLLDEKKDENPDEQKKQQARWVEGITPPRFSNVSVRKISEPFLDPTNPSVQVFVYFTDDDGAHSTVWDVVMTAPKDLQSTVHWRIVSVQNR
jgi:hypothetical protein